jgi:hydrogenase maturation protease
MTTAGVAAVQGTQSGLGVSIRRSAVLTEPEWETNFRRVIREQTPRRLNLVGVGNPFRSDDGVGLSIVQSLRKELHRRPTCILKVHSPNSNPEGLVSKLASAGKPLFVVDAVQTGAPPGTIVCAPMSCTKFGFFATHNIPLRLVPGVDRNIGSAFVLGVEPQSVEFGEGLTPIVRAAARELVRRIILIAEGN